MPFYKLKPVLGLTFISTFFKLKPVLSLTFLLLFLSQNNSVFSQAYNATTWSSSNAYNGGAKATYNGRNYTAQYYTSNRRPDIYCTTCGTQGTYTHWVDNGACSSCSTVNEGSIGSAQTICYNSTPSSLTNSTSASGGSGSYSYQWQSPSNNSTWSNISGATSSTYAPGALTSSTYYRRAVKSGSCNMPGLYIQASPATTYYIKVNTSTKNN